jgi:hypothetical protein
LREEGIRIIIINDDIKSNELIISKESKANANAKNLKQMINTN